MGSLLQLRSISDPTLGEAAGGSIALTLGSLVVSPGSVTIGSTTTLDYDGLTAASGNWNLVVANAAGSAFNKLALSSTIRTFLDADDQAAGRTALGLGTAAVAASGDFAAASHTHTLSDLTQSGASTNQIPQWNGSAWVPATITSGGTWGSITGTLSSQTDLQTALDARAVLASANTFSVGGQIIQTAASVVGLSLDAASSPTTDILRARVGGTTYAAFRQFPTPSGTTYASPVRLWMSSGAFSLSVGPDEGWVGFTLRNAADNGWAALVCGLVNSQSGVNAPFYMTCGNIELSSSSWRADRIGLGSGTAVAWCSGTSGTGTADTRLVRHAAGAVRVTDGTTGQGLLLWGPVSQTDAAAANNSVYYSTTAGKLVYKDAGGTVNNLY